MDKELPNPQSIRMKGWDYTSAGCYFVTINTHKSRALFGVIVNGRMVLNEAGRVAEDVEAPSIRQAAWCNQYVLAHCDRTGVGHLNPGGMLACILSESDPELEIVYL